MNALLAEIRDLARRVDEDELPDLEIEDLSARARLQGRSASRAEQADLLDAMAALEASVERSLERMAAALRENGQRRSAISAYGAVRAHTRAQNLRTRI